ncbi:MAG: hypothetical protein ACRDXB_10655, partial [Actinomycetes bacterium]
MKKILAGVAATTLAVGGMLVATATSASAHTPAVEDSCTSLKVNLTQYSGAAVTVTVDGATVAQEQFDRAWDRTFELDGATAHTWTIDVDARDGRNGTQYDWSGSGSTEPCPPTTPE